MTWKRLRYVLVLIALCSIATCPTATRACDARNHAREAEQLLRVIADHVATRVATTGKVPPTAAPPTPRPSCCEQGGTCSYDAQTWAAPGWRELEFSVDGTYRFTYEYIPDPSGMSALARAVGDLDCDGTASTYEVRLDVKGSQVERVWSRKDPYE